VQSAHPEATTQPMASRFAGNRSIRAKNSNDAVHKNTSSAYGRASCE